MSHWVISEGHEPITGDSLIVTLKEQFDEPQEFVAVQVTLVVPVANVLPLTGEHETEAAGVPVAVGSVHVATKLSHCVMFEGQALITGVVLIVTLKEQEELPFILFAVQVTDVVPVVYEVPEAGEQLTVAAGAPVDEGVENVAT